MLQAQTKRDVGAILTLALEVLETWEGTKKEKDTDASLSELLRAVKFCSSALERGDTWQDYLTRALEIDDGFIDENEAIAIGDIRAIAEDKARLEAVQAFLAK